MNYLAKPAADKDFNASSVSVWVRLCMFQQLKLAYGDAFYHQLHRLARRDANRPSTTDTRMRWFMVNASRAAGRNLSAFFKAWGLKLSATAATDAAYAEVEDLIFDLMYEINLPEVDALIKQCHNVTEKLNDEIEAEQELENVKRMVMTLERAGYKVVKA
jgi:hypothetical protein